MHVLRLCSVFEAPARPGGRGFDDVGGMQRHTAAITRGLDDLGVRQTVVTAFRPGAPREERIGRAAVVHRVGLPVGHLRQWWAMPALVEATRARRIDLVHAHLGEDIAVLPIAAAVARRSRVPMVVTVHSSPSFTVRGLDPRTRAIVTIGGLAERRLLPSAARILTLTGRAADALAGLVPRDRIEVIPLGIDGASAGPPGEDPVPDAGHPRILCVARLVRAKGVDLALDAVAGLPGAKLVVVGDGPERAALLHRSGEHDLAGRCTFVGSVAPDVVAAHMRHADVLAVPSRYEEAGRAVVEGMAAGVPVVAAAVGGIPSILRDGENGLLARPDDAGALGAAIGRVVSDETLRRRLVLGGRRTAAEHGVAELVARVAATYAALTRNEAFLVRLPS